MNPEEFYEKMLELQKLNDEEMSHIKMDDLMCDVLKFLGYEKGVEIFDSTDKWYS